MVWTPDDDGEEDFLWKDEDEEEIDPEKGRALSKFAPVAIWAFAVMGLFTLIAILGRLFRSLSGG